MKALFLRSGGRGPISVNFSDTLQTHRGRFGRCSQSVRRKPTIRAATPPALPSAHAVSPPQARPRLWMGAVLRVNPLARWLSCNWHLSR